MPRQAKTTWFWALALLAGLSGIAPRPTQAADHKTENVILIHTDGLRWQEVFTGADPALLPKPDSNHALIKNYWREDLNERRAVLMPFFWNVIAKQGQLYGNQKKGSVARVTNDQWFSYPGRNEFLTGAADPEIRSNAKVPNKNVTVLEWLHQKPAFQGAVAAFSGWDVVPFILNRERCGFPVMGGWEPVPETPPSPRMALLNELIEDTTPATPAENFDSIIFQAARNYLVTKQPRVLFIDFLETDHWAHAGRYDNVLRTVQKVDDYVRRLWETVQASDHYRDKTTLILVTDHGRGEAPEKWKSHGAKIDGAQNIWMAFLGPDTPALGERTDCPEVTQSQIAATLAALLGENYNQAVPTAALPVTDALPPAGK